MTTPAKSQRPGLADLDRISLTADQESLVIRLVGDGVGPLHWRRRMEHELRRLLALVLIAPRLRVLALELRTSLKALLELRTPVPCLPPRDDGAPGGELVVGDRVTLAVQYPERILYQPIPGTEPVDILSPPWIHHPNVAPGAAPVHPLCLGPNVPRNTPLVELVIASYAALTLQSVTIGEDDPAGVMNREAALWWQSRRDLIPLSTIPFLGPPDDAGVAP